MGRNENNIASRLHPSRTDRGKNQALLSVVNEPQSLKTTSQLSGSGRGLFLLYPNGKRCKTLAWACFFFALTVLLLETTDIERLYDLKMKSLFLVETVVLAGFVLLSQVTAKVRPNASGISRIQDGG